MCSVFGDCKGELGTGSILGTIISAGSFLIGGTCRGSDVGLRFFCPGLTVPGVTDFLGGIRTFLKLLVVDGGDNIGGVVTLLYILLDGCTELSLLGTTKLLVETFGFDWITG